MSIPLPGEISPSIYTQSSSSSVSDTSGSEPEPVKPLVVRKSPVRGKRYDFARIIAGSKGDPRDKLYDFGPNTRAATDNSSNSSHNRHTNLDLENPTSSSSSLPQSVQPPHLHSLSPSLSSKHSSASAGRKVMTMEQPLTSHPSSSRAPEDPSPTRLQYSPSTPFFPQHHPLRTTGSPSTPDLRRNLKNKKSILGRFKGGVKGFFRREKKEPKADKTLSALYAFEQPVSIMEEQGQLVAGPKYEHSIAGHIQNLTVASTVVEQSQPPSPPPIHEFDGESDNEYDDSASAPDGSVAESHSPTLSPLDSASPIYDPNLTPAEREARRLGLELDFSDVHRMNSESSANDKIVRQYTDLPPSFYASRKARPIYSGASISSSKSHLPAPQPIGQWQCCKCGRQQALYHHDKGEHPVSILLCVCPHRSCENCTLTGSIKLYKPVQEPFPVLDCAPGSELKFGIFCSTCGLSWRAQKLKTNSTTVLAKISAVPKNLGATVGVGIKGSKSMHNLRSQPPLPASTLNLRALSNEMEKEHGKQAESVLVYFSGIMCTCGTVLDSSSLGFQIVPGLRAHLVQEDRDVLVKKEEPTFSATRMDKERGIGMEMLTIEVGGKRIRHENPLMSHAVE